MTKRIIQNSFAAGELSPDMGLRTDLRGFYSSVKEGKNFIPTFQGPANTRRGTVHLLYISTTYDTRFPLNIVNQRLLTIEVAGYPWLLWFISSQTGSYGTLIASPIQIDPTGLVQGYYTIGSADFWKYDMQHCCITPVPGEDNIFIVGENRLAKQLTKITSSPYWEVTSISFTAKPSEWGSYGPSAMCFYQGRAYYGEGNYFWGSVTSEYDNLTIGSDPDDAFKYQLPANCTIRWMVGLESLIIGTDEGEYIVTSQDGVVMPGDIQVKKQSGYGSAHMQPVNIGHGVLYVTADRKKLRYISYSWEDDQWVSKNLLFASEHFTEGDYGKITSVAFNSLTDQIFCTLGDGRVIVGLYSQDEQSTGWMPLDYYSPITSLAVGKFSDNIYGVLLATHNTSGQFDSFCYYDDVNAQLDNCYYELGEYLLPAGTEISCSAYVNKTNISIYYDMPELVDIWNRPAVQTPTGDSVADWITDGGGLTNNGSEYIHDLTGNHFLGLAWASYPIRPTNSEVGFEVGKTYKVAFEIWFDSGTGFTATPGQFYIQTESNILSGNTVLSNIDIEDYDQWVTVEATFKVQYIPYYGDDAYYIMFVSTNTNISTGEVMKFRNITMERIDEGTPEILHNQDITSSPYTTDRECRSCYIGKSYTCKLETRDLSEQDQGTSHGDQSAKKRIPKAFVKIIDSFPAIVEGEEPSEYTKGDHEIQVSQRGWDRETTITIEQNESYYTKVGGIYGVKK